jgi:hypothetical protein
MRKLGGVGAAAPPIIPIKRPAFDENEHASCQPTGSARNVLFLSVKSLPRRCALLFQSGSAQEIFQIGRFNFRFWV